MQTNYYIYADILLEGEIFYIGKGSGGRIHKYQRNPRHDNIWRKYDCTREIVIDNLDEETAFMYEKFWIAQLHLNWYKYPENHFACNMTDGGDGPAGRKLSQDHKDKLSVCNKGEKNHYFGKKHTPEILAKMSAAHKGKPSPKKGKPCSEETKSKLRISCGHKMSEVNKAKLSRCMKEKQANGGFTKGKKIHSEEFKDNLRKIKRNAKGQFGSRVQAIDDEVKYEQEKQEYKEYNDLQIPG